MLRTLRLIKLSKLLTGTRIIKRWETQVAINYAAISLFKCLVGMLLLSHWFACIWGLQASFADSKLNTWLGGSSDLCQLDSQGTMVCEGPGTQYASAIYWAVMTITSIGYGDISATPGNVSEHIMCTLLMTGGAIGWGIVLGTIVQNLSSLDPEGDEFSATMSQLNLMMSREDLPKHMQVRPVALLLPILLEYLTTLPHLTLTSGAAARVLPANYPHADDAEALGAARADVPDSQSRGCMAMQQRVAPSRVVSQGRVSGIPRAAGSSTPCTGLRAKRGVPRGQVVHHPPWGSPLRRKGLWQGASMGRGHDSHVRELAEAIFCSRDDIPISVYAIVRQSHEGA